MRLIRQHALGGPEVLQLEEAPRPDPGPTEVLVRTAAAGVNPVDWKTRARGGFIGDPPFTVGWDVAGIVETAGRGVTRFQPGDRVFGLPLTPSTERAPLGSAPGSPTGSATSRPVRSRSPGSRPGRRSSRPPA